MCTIKEKIEAGLNDVYFGNGDKFIVGGIEFNRFGFTYANENRRVVWDEIKVTDDGESEFIWVDFIGEKNIAVGIRRSAITEGN